MTRVLRFTFLYDPPGATGPSTASFQSWIAIRVGPTGARTRLWGPPNPTVTGTSTTGTSTFTSNGMTFTLVQTVGPLFNGPTRTGSLLTQTYTITNPTAATINFEIVRYNVTDMLGSLNQLGGRVASPTETVYERENVPVSRIVVGFTGLGGTIPATNRFEVSQYSTLRTNILAGNALSDSVTGDGNADGETDASSDVGEALRNTFSLAPGATVVYTTHTFFGTGVPSTIFVVGPPPPPPPPPGPGSGTSGPEGSYTGSNGSSGSSGEGGFGFGARRLQPSTLAGPFLRSPGGSFSLVSPGSVPFPNLSVLNVTHGRTPAAVKEVANEEGPSSATMLLATVLAVTTLLAAIKGARYLLS